ncbi:esterase family protein [bacterium]|nr:esterase family protein [bacterium]
MRRALVSALAALLCPPAGWSASGHVVSGTLESAILGRSMVYHVFLPGASPQMGDGYPVVYFLDGLHSRPERWFRWGGMEIAERLLESSTAVPFAVVVADADNSFYVNMAGGRGNYEDYFIKEVIPTLEQRFPIRADRDGRALSGTSMGGYGAIKLGLKYPELFGSVSAHSAMLLPVPLEQIPESYKNSWGWRGFTLAFGNPPDPELWRANDPWVLLASREAGELPAIYFDCGTEDRYRFFDGAKVLSQKMKAAGVAHEFHLYPGNHGWEYLNTVMDKSLAFHNEYFRKNPPRPLLLRGER